MGSLILTLLSFFEHQRTIRTSFLLNIYLFVTVFLDAARSRTYSLIRELDTVSVVFTTRVGIKLFLAIFEARSKVRTLLPEYVGAPPEATSGVYSRALFWWQNALFRRGYTDALKIDDLFGLDKFISADYLQRRLETAWNKSTLPNDPLNKYWQADFGIRSTGYGAEFVALGDFGKAEVVHIGSNPSETLSHCL